MKKKNLKKWIIIGVVIVVLVLIIGIITAVISGVSKRENKNNENSYKNSYQYKMQREKNLEVLKSFYGNYIVTGVSGTSPSITLQPDELKTLENDMNGTQVNIEENQFMIKYHATDAVNGNTFENATINNPYYEVNQTNETMFQEVYKTGLSNVGISSATPYFINVGAKDNYAQEIIQDGKGGLLIYSQGVFFKMEAASKILQEQNAQLAKLANDAFKVVNGNTYQYIFPVQQINNNGKFEYKSVPSGALFMCKSKDNSLTPDKDTMFITLTQGVVQPPANTNNTDNKDNGNKDNKDKNNGNDKNKAEQDKNAGKPFYNFSITTAAMMDQTQPNKPITGKVYLDGAVEVTK